MLPIEDLMMPYMFQSEPETEYTSLDFYFKLTSIHFVYLFEATCVKY